MGLFGSDSMIGLDIGTHSIKAVRVDAAKGSWQVTAAGSVPTPPGALVEGKAVPEVLVPALKQLLKQGTWSGGITAALNFTAAIAIQRRPLPMASPAQLRKQIEAAPDQFGLGSAKDSVNDFEILGRLDGEPPQLDTLLVSAPRDQVETRVKAIRSAGGSPLVVDLEPWALLRALVECKPAMASVPRSLAIVDMGASHTDVTIIRSGSYFFTRPIPFCGDAFTEAIRQAMECEVSEAEALKAGIDLHWLMEGPGEHADTPAYKAATAISSLLDDLLREVRNSIVFYHAQLPEDDTDGMVSAVLLAGGTAQMKGMAEYVGGMLQVPVERANIADGLMYPVAPHANALTAESSSLFALAVGLAVKEAMDRDRAAQAAPAKAAGKARPKKEKGPKKKDAPAKESQAAA